MVRRAARRLLTRAIITVPVVSVVVACGSIDEPAPPSSQHPPHLQSPQCKPDMGCVPEEGYHHQVFVVRRLPWAYGAARPPCPSGTSLGPAFGLEPAFESSCAPCTCGAPKGTCRTNVSSYKDASCSTTPGQVGFGTDEMTCRQGGPRPPSQLPAWMTAAPGPANFLPACQASEAKLVPAEPFRAMLDTCRIPLGECYRGSASKPERCYDRPAGRLCRTPPGEVCPADFPVRVRAYESGGQWTRVAEFRSCTRCACKATNVACEGGELRLYCDTTCSGDGGCSTPTVTLGKACTDVTEIMSQPFSWRQTLPTLRGECDAVQSSFSLQFAPKEVALCCHEE
jgi:hypothetical protein